MKKEAVIEYAQSISGAAWDKPFDGDFDTTVLRHSDTRKWFGIIMNHEGRDILNLKCEPDHSDFLKQQFEGIIEAYHMNKRLWITVILESDVPDDELKRLISHSFILTDKKKKSKKQ